jgi:hypothetical protein
MKVDEARNAECYASTVTTHAILSGEAPAPAELTPLYERINAMMHT